MQEKASNTGSPNLARAVLAPAATGCALGCLSVLGLGILALYMGFCFIWLDDAPNGGIIIFLVVLATAIVFKAKNRPTPWKIFFIEIGAIAFLWVVFSVWTAPRTLGKAYFRGQIPAGVVIHHAHWFQDGPDPLMWIHFSASPEVIMAVIKTNDMAEESRPSVSAPRTPSWWKPQEMSKPTFYTRVHPLTASNNIWEVSAWVNDATNEVFGIVY
ncbi:MAG: hypothetical protein NTY53_06810 [Kiritimatiellaeota bacterium]|nr:hypothetical protein [Kiritimatiellota bacterium]